MSHSSNNTNNSYTNNTRRMSTTLPLGANLSRVTSDQAVEEKTEREIELQIRLVSGDKFTIVANIEELVWDVKQKVSQALLPPPFSLQS